MERLLVGPAQNLQQTQNARAAFHPPQALHFIDTQPDGSWSLRPYIHPYTLKRDPQTLAANFGSLAGSWWVTVKITLGALALRRPPIAVAG